MDANEVERVARLMSAAYLEWYEANVPAEAKARWRQGRTWAGVPPSEQDAYRHVARAVLADLAGRERCDVPAIVESRP